MARRAKRYTGFRGEEPIWGMALRLNGTNQGTEEERQELAQLLAAAPVTEEELNETEGMALHMKERSAWYREELYAGRVPSTAVGIVERMVEDAARICGLLPILKALVYGGEPVWND